MDIHFDKEKNRIIVKIGEEEIEIPPQTIRDILPVKSEAEKLEDLKMILHDIKRERLTKIENYVKKMAELAKNTADARGDLKKCNDMVCIKKWTAVGKNIINEKNSLAEIRRAVGLLWKDEKKILARIAKLEVGMGAD